MCQRKYVYGVYCTWHARYTRMGCEGNEQIADGRECTCFMLETKFGKWCNREHYKHHAIGMIGWVKSCISDIVREVESYRFCRWVLLVTQGVAIGMSEKLQGLFVAVSTATY